MVNAGASIEAYLRLNATDFREGLETAETAVKTFKESMLDVGNQGSTLSKGVRGVSNALDQMIKKMELLNTVDDKSITKLKQLGLALEHIATGAQRLGADARRGGEGLEMLNTVMDIFQAGMSSAEVTINATVGQLRAFKNEVTSAKSTMTQLSESEKVLQSQFQLLDNTMQHTNMQNQETRAVARQLREEYGVTGVKLRELIQIYYQGVNATVQYAQALNQPILPIERQMASLGKLSASYVKVTTTMQRWKSLTDSIVNSTAQSVANATNTINSSLNKLSTGLNNTVNASRNASTGAKQFTSSLNSTDGTIAKVNTGVRQYAHALTIPTKYMVEGGVQAEKYRVLQKGVNLTIEDNINFIRRQSEEMQRNAQEKLKAMGYTKQLGTAEKELTTSTNQANSSLQREVGSLQSQASASQRAASATNRQTTATRGLGRALSSLRMIGTMVGSMMVWNFAHNLITATRETVNAKSEMEGYFKMLNFGQKDIDHFNKALNDTVSQFQRVNKYSLGETISSIGVEFNLSTKEMEKAMKVTSMITSEYLRAGRNANEASLAVKDVLQGQFQRLSRETGVKGEQLKEAGWSGDTTDVLGLMEALEKVGKSRNWDVFAEKANSLNDIVTIIQNRFGEWSADMVNVVQPSIVGAFNSIMSFAQGLSESLSHLWQWLNTDGFTQTAVKVGALATSVYSLTTAFAMYRTGASLVTLRNTSLLKTIYSLITGTKLEEMANLSVRDSIVAKLLGIKSEEVAEKGLVGAINANLVAQKLNTVANEESTVARGFNTASIQSQMTGLTAETDAEELNYLAKQLNVTATGEQTGATIGFTGALWGMITGEGLAEGATLSLTGAIGALTGAFLASPVGWFALAILGLASAFYVLTGGLDESWDKMKQFNQAMQDPHSTIQPYRDEVTRISGELDKAKEKYGENSDKVKQLEEDLDSAKESLDNITHSVEHGVYWNGEYKKSFEGIDAEVDKITRKKLGDLGVSDEDIDKVSELADVMDTGAEKSYHALQVLHKQQSNYSDGVDDLTKRLKDAKITGDDWDKAQSDYARHSADLMKHSAIANTSEDWWEWSWNSLYAGLDQLWIDLDDAKIRFAQWWNTDVPKSLQDAEKDLGKMWDGADEWFTGGLQGIQDSINDWLGDAGKSIGDSWKDLTEMWDNNIKKPVMDWWNGFISFDWLFGGDSGESTGTPSGMKKINILGFFKSINLSGIVEWFDNTIKKPVMDWWSGFISFDWLPSVDFNFLTGLLGVGGYVGDITWLTDWLNTNLVTPLVNFALNPIGTLASWGLSIPSIDLGSLIQGLFNIGGGGFDVGAWLGSIFNIDNIVSTFTTNLGIIFTTASNIATNVGNVFSNLKSMIWNHIQGILSNVTTTFTNIKNTAVNQINGLRDGIQGGIDRVKDAFRVMKDSILNSAKLIYDGVKSKFDSVKKTIGDFWNNLTNPSSWGSAGSESYQRRSPKPQTARKMFAGSPVVRSAVHHGAGVNPYQNDSQSVKLKDLMSMVDGDNKVRLSDFLAMFSEGGFGAWDFHEPYKKRTFDVAKTYKTGSPSIKGIGTVGDGYQVGRFWDGKPKFSFEEFQAVAQAIFSAIPYKFYYDSEWKGNWVNALLSGAVNCSDGADALIALARVFGFDGYKQHTTLNNGVGHFFAVIGGKAMDTTNFQNHGSWSPLGGAGIPTRSASYIGRTGETQGKTVNVTVDMSNSTIYGVDDLDERIAEGVDKGMQKHMNDPFTIAI